jgi:hypothetical protein
MSEIYSHENKMRGRHAYILLHGVESFLRNQKLLGHSRNSQNLIEPEGLLPCWQDPTNGLYPEPDEFSLYPYSFSPRCILILSSHLCLGLPNGHFPSGFPTKTVHAPLYSHMRATCPAHRILSMACVFQLYLSGSTNRQAPLYAGGTR